MPLPEVTITIQDNALGQLPASTGNASAKIGVCSDGIVGTVVAFGDMTTMQSSLGQGPLVDAISHTMGVPGTGTVYGLPINPSVAGATGSVTHTGPGTGAITVALAPRVSVALKITTGGVINTMAFAVSLNGGAYGTPVVTSGGAPFSYAVPGTLTTVTFAAGTYVLNDVYTIATDGLVTLVGSGPAASNVTHTDSPLDVYSVLVVVKGTGAAGVGSFTWSVDGGNSNSGTILIPSGSRFAIPNTGVVLVFSGTFTAGDTYAFTTTTAGYSNGDVTTSMGVLLGSSFVWRFVHLVGTGANAAAAASTAAVVDTQMVAAKVVYRFTRAVIECPIVEADATIVAALASFASAEGRVTICVGDAALVSPLNGRILRRNSAWVFTARAASIVAGEDPAYVARGRLPNVVSLYPNFGSTKWDPTLLDAGRFTTLRTFPGLPGYYVTNGNTMASPGSDFNLWQRGVVMDIACSVARAGELPYLNGSLRVDPTSGFIDERDAQAFEGKVNGMLKAALVDSGNASSSSVVVNRATNVLSTNTLPVTVRVVPLFYAKTIATNIGFSNPALQV